MQGISQQLLRKTLISLSLPPKLPSPATRAPIGPPLPAPFGLATSAPSLPRFLFFHFYSIFVLFFILITLPPSQIIEKKPELAKLEAIDCGKSVDEAAWDIVISHIPKLQAKNHRLKLYHCVFDYLFL